MSVPSFTAHNIRLDGGRRTIPDAPLLVEEWPGFHSLRRLLDVVFPAGKENHRIVDLGCLEGGYSVGFARMGFEAVGIEVRDANFQCCAYVKEHVSLPNLQFVQDNVLNFSSYGRFDTVFCCGLLYHLDQPKAFLEQVAKQTKKMLILGTHFSIQSDRVKSVFSVTGKVVFNTLNICPQDSVQIWVNGTFYGNFTELDGTYALALNEPGNYIIEPRNGDHVFSPTQINLGYAVIILLMWTLPTLLCVPSVER